MGWVVKAALPLGERAGTPFTGGWVGPQGRSGPVRKISLPSGLPRRTVQPVASRCSGPQAQPEDAASIPPIQTEIPDTASATSLGIQTIYFLSLKIFVINIVIKLPQVYLSFLLGIRPPVEVSMSLCWIKHHSSGGVELELRAFLT